MSPTQRPILSDEELKELIAVSARVIEPNKRALFWLSVRTYYFFISLAIYAYFFYFQREQLVLMHFQSAEYVSYLVNEYTIRRFYTAVATTLLYAYGFYTKKHFRMIAFSVFILASLNLINDLSYIYTAVDYRLSLVPSLLLANRFLVIFFLWMNFRTINKLNRRYYAD